MKRIRRIITGHDSRGLSCFMADSLMSSPHHPGNNPAHSIFDLWKTTSSPASNGDEARDAALDGNFRLSPPEGGTVLRIIDLPPDTRRDFSKMGQIFAAYGASAALAADNARHPAFHKTRSVDYAMVLEGEVWALMDEGETLMQAGDVLIQCGTHHAWSNRTEHPCRMLFVLIDAEPLPDLHGASASRVAQRAA